MTALFLLFAMPVRAEQDVSVAAKAQPTQVTIGDRINLQIHVIHPESFVLQSSTASSIGEFLITNTQKSARSKGKDLIDEKLDLTLVTFSTGTLIIPSASLTLTRVQSQPLEFKTPDIPITVQSVLDRHKDRGDIQEIKGQVGFFDPLPWILGALALALLYFLIRQLAQRGAAGAAVKKGPPPRPAEEVAREALLKLQGKKFIEEGRTKEFYIELSEIMRRYIEERFGVPCLDRTTTEIVAEIKSLALSSADFCALRELLQDSDLVKFARFVPPPEEPHRHLQTAFALIDHTTPQSVPPTPAAAPIP